MKKVKIRGIVAALAIGTVATGLTGCGGKKKDSEIERLNGVVEEARKDGERQREQFDEQREETRALTSQVRDLERQLKQQEKEAAGALRELERLKQREELAKVEKAREPSSTEKRLAAKALAAEFIGATVSVVGDKSTSSGFLVEADEKIWIYMTASELNGNSTLEVSQTGGGQLTQFGAFELANGLDLARLELKDEAEKKMILAASAGELKSGTPLLGFNEAGALADGRSYGSEGTILKVDSRFASCPLGSPVFHGETGALLGMMSEPLVKKRVLWKTENAGSSRSVRQVLRLDLPIIWTAIPIGSFLEESKAIETADELTRLVSAFASVRPSDTGLSMDGSLGGGQTVRGLLDANKTMSSVRSLYQLDEWLKEKGARSSKSDLNRKISGVFAEVGRASTRDTKEFEARKFSPFHAEAAAQSLEWRKDAEKELAETMNSEQ